MITNEDLLTSIDTRLGAANNDLAVMRNVRLDADATINRLEAQITELRWMREQIAPAPTQNSEAPRFICAKRIAHYYRECSADAVRNLTIDDLPDGIKDDFRGSTLRPALTIAVSQLLREKNDDDAADICHTAADAETETEASS